MDWVAAVARFAGGVVAAMLPRRFWPRLSEHVPVHAAALASAGLTAVTGAVLGITGFLRYAAGAASANNAAMLEIASQTGVVSTAPTFLSTLDGVVFALMTVEGAGATYLVASGVLRAAAAIVDDPLGDPLLTLTVAAVARTRAKGRASREAARRRRREGPEVPDVVVRAVDLGIREGVWAVVASRRKDGWEENVFVLSDRGVFRIGRPFDREFPGGLRRVYPLEAAAAAGVVRRAVRYDLGAAGRDR